MTSNQIIRIMEHLGYRHETHPRYKVFHGEFDIKAFTSWSDCEAWMKNHRDYKNARYRAMRAAKEMRKKKC